MPTGGALTVAQERTRLARELHDSLGHALTALDVQMELLVRLPLQQLKRGSKPQTGPVAGQAGPDRPAPGGAGALRPTAVDSFSLPEAGAALVAEFSADTHLPIEWQVVGSEFPLSPH
jgi:signal transduction histidine kinase